MVGNMWSGQEVFSLVKAFFFVKDTMDIAEAPFMSTDFWGRVHEYHCSMYRINLRTKKQLVAKWREVKKDMDRFNIIYHNIQLQRRPYNFPAPPGFESIFLTAKLWYREQYNKEFEYRLAWTFVNLNNDTILARI